MFFKNKHYAASIAAAKYNNDILVVKTVPIISKGKIEEIIGQAHKLVEEEYPKSDGWLTTISIACLENPKENYLSRS